MSLKKTNDNRGSYRGAGAYSRDYCKWDNSDAIDQLPAREIWSKVEGTGDYDGVFTGPVSTGNRNRWPPLADRQNTRGDGAYSHEGRRATERPRKQSDGSPNGGQKVSD